MSTATDLAAALRGGGLPPTESLAARAEYHGIGPLLLARSGADVLRPQARARAMWELRHRMVVTALLADLAGAGIRVIVMKGTALAYDLYAEAALRPRGDTDLLIAPQDLDTARSVLRRRGFTAAFDGDTQPDAGHSQEPWAFVAPDGSSHDIDLHWAPFNGAALANLMPLAEIFAEAVPLPRLSPEARALSRGHAILHACVHRAQHILSPYFVDGVAHYGGDRLIWLCDIDLLARALTPPEWEHVTSRAAERGIAPVCLGTLEDAEKLLGTPLPAQVRERLAAAPAGSATGYLLGGSRTGRAIADLRAMGAGNVPRYAIARLFPPPSLVRSQYPHSRLPMPFLYMRRLWRFLTGGRL